MAREVDQVPPGMVPVNPSPFYKRWGCLVSLLVFIGAAVAYGSLNYSGFCIPEGRWLSENELFDKPARSAFRFYPPSQVKLPGKSYIDVINPVVYNSYEEFRLANKGCCNIAGDRYLGVEVADVGIWNRFFGRFREVISVRYIAQEQPRFIVPVGYYIVNNCGETDFPKYFY